MKNSSAVLCALVLCLGAAGAARRHKRIVGGEAAEEPPPDSQSPIAFVDKMTNTLINGLDHRDGYYSFLGIRYARPPIGPLRFQRPKRIKLKGVVNATKYGPPCPQPTPGNDGFVGSEDCLFLNVHTPHTGGNKSVGLPVLVWIHGGNFRRGSAAQYEPKFLAKKGIVVVTIQYRLGSLGFLSIGRDELPGNVGLFDLMAGMRWVIDNVGYLGGDPTRIVAGGQGSGASAATMLALNQDSKAGLRGILAMSGSPISPFSVDKFETATSEEISAIDGCGLEEGMKFVRCMQQLSLEDIMKGDNAVQDSKEKSNEFPKNLASLQGPGPAEEGAEDDRFLPYFIVEAPLMAVKKGSFPDIPLLNGVTKEETKAAIKGNFLTDVYKKLLSPSFLQAGLYNDLLEANTGLYANKTVDPQLKSLFLNTNYLQFFTKVITSALSDLEKVIKHTTDAFFNLPAFVTSSLWSQQSKVYLYSFEHMSDRSITDNLLSGFPLIQGSGAVHGDDLKYLFEIRSLDGSPLDNSMTSIADLRVREHFTNIVAEFVRTGVPKVKGGPTWTPFEAKQGNYMVISEKPKMARNFRKCEMGLWTGDAGLLSTSECSFLGAAAKVVTDTIGSAGSSLLSGVASIGSLDVGGAVNNLGDTLKPLTKPLDPFGILDTQPSGKNPSTTRRPGSGGILGFGGIFG
ncbi:hypothetical protein AAG570_010588 [Ranatra chinensis]|uniref:Carboxylesterase type B domain-containing protein n=1 Tax=Ranatra chinensis TaxID=642074 RepID=A0ABD0YNF8_9HEMI